MNTEKLIKFLIEELHMTDVDPGVQASSVGIDGKIFYSTVLEVDEIMYNITHWRNENNC